MLAFCSALSQPKFRKVIEQYFDAVADSEDSFTALNTAFGREGAFGAYPQRRNVLKSQFKSSIFRQGSIKNLMLQPRNLGCGGSAK